MIRGFTRSLVLAAGLAAFAAPALAQSKSKPDQPLLGGPKVGATGVPGEHRTFGGQPAGRKDRMGDEIPHRLFMHAVDSLKGDAAVRLSDDQAARIKGISDEFTAQVDAYRQQHGEEAKELMSKVPPEDRRRIAEALGLGGPGREGGPGAKTPGERPFRRPGAAKGKRTAETGAQPDPMQDKPSQAQAEKAREQLKALFEAAPKPADTHAKIFAVLNDAQKKAVQESIEKTRAELEKRRGENRKDAKKPGDAKPGDTKPGDAGGERGRALVQNLPEDVRAKLKGMEPAERREFIRKYLADHPELRPQKK